MALAYVVGTATQGSADAFVQAEIATALSGQTSRAMRIREILFEYTAQHFANNSVREVCISRRSMSAMPNITDRNVIAKWTTCAVLTTSGAAVTQLVNRLQFSEDDELLVVEDPLYLVLDSATTSLTNVVYCRIGYELVNINANDRLQLALQSLNESA